MAGALLLFEPEQGSRELLERNLRDDGFEVLGATRDGEALDLVERTRPDLVVATGLELCRRLRAGEPGRTWDRNVPVIVVTQPSSDSTTSRYIQPAEPVYQLQPPRPVCGGTL